MRINKIILMTLLIFCPFVGYSQEDSFLFVSLRKPSAHLRTGPGVRFPARFIYQKTHYPFQVVDEYEGWKQVKERDGTVGWIHENSLSKKRYVVFNQDIKLLSKKTEKAKVRAFVKEGVIAEILKCPQKEALCLIKIDEIEGWVDKNSLWGVYSDEII